jgi:hypothetical protein
MYPHPYAVNFLTSDLFKIDFKASILFLLDLLSGPFYSGFPTKLLYLLLIYSTCVTLVGLVVSLLTYDKRTI